MADELLTPEPLRGLSVQALADAEGDFDGITYGLGMHTAAGAARLEAAVLAVRGVLAGGAGREVALAVLFGSFVRLERDGHREYSDTVVRETVTAELEGDCLAAGVDPFTDDEVAEVSVLLAERALAAVGSAWLAGLAGR